LKIFESHSLTHKCQKVDKFQKHSGLLWQTVDEKEKKFYNSFCHDSERFFRGAETAPTTWAHYTRAGSGLTYNH